MTSNPVRMPRIAPLARFLYQAFHDRLRHPRQIGFGHPVADMPRLKAEAVDAARQTFDETAPR